MGSLARLGAVTVTDPDTGVTTTTPFGEAGFRRQNQALNQDTEIHFRATETLDNGIQIGARVQLEAASVNNGSRTATQSQSAGGTRDQIDERHIFFKGGFGEIRIGDEDDARKLKSYTAPDPTGYIFSVNSPYFTFRDLGAGQVVSSNSTTANLENDSAKIIYYQSPPLRA
jgi:outer membrane protein OmpU